MIIFVGALQLVDCSDAEKQLQKYADEYFAGEFVPFPTAQDAVDVILETVGYVDIGDKVPFVDVIIKLLTEWKQKELEDYGE